MELFLMSYFKKFTDFFAGVAAFVCALFILRKYMEFTPPNKEEGAPAKFIQFLETSATDDYLMLIAMVLILALSVIISIVFRKLPYACFAFSIVPAVYICYLFGADKLAEQDALFIIAIALQMIGNLVECILRDREDGGHRLFIASKLSYVMGIAVCIYMIKSLNEPHPETIEGLNTFEKELFAHLNPLDVGIITSLVWMLAIIMIVGLLLYNVYFIDAILSLIPLGFVMFKFTFEKLTFAPFIFICVTSVCALSNIMLAFFENNLSKKEQFPPAPLPEIESDEVTEETEMENETESQTEAEEQLPEIVSLENKISD